MHMLVINRCVRQATSPHIRTHFVAPKIPSHLLQDFQSKVNSLDFHRTEDLLITASDDDSIRLYNTATGKQGEVC